MIFQFAWDSSSWHLSASIVCNNVFFYIQQWVGWMVIYMVSISSMKGKVSWDLKMGRTDCLGQGFIRLSLTRGEEVCQKRGKHLKRKERAYECESDGCVQERAIDWGCHSGTLILKPGCTLESPGELSKLPKLRLLKLNQNLWSWILKLSRWLQCGSRMWKVKSSWEVGDRWWLGRRGDLGEDQLMQGYGHSQSCSYLSLNVQSFCRASSDWGRCGEALSPLTLFCYSSNMSQ